MRFFKWIFVCSFVVFFALACESRPDKGGSEKAPARWRMAAMHFDDDGDGKTDETCRFRYDSAGRLASIEYDGSSSRYNPVSPDGRTDVVVRYRYDDEGRLASSGLDSDNDGKIEGVEKSGIISSESITHYAYDEEGRRVREEYDSMFRPEEKGVVDSVTHYTYDAGGRTTVRRFDTDADGKVDSVESYHYDAEDRHIKTLNDFNNDGEPDGICAYIYGETGKKERKLCDGRHVSMYDSSPPDGTVDRTATYFYDERGLMIREEGDYDGDGTVDWYSRYAYDEYGNELVYENFKGETYDLTSAHCTDWEKIPPGMPEPADLMPPIPLPL
jgi:serralysin